MPSSLRIPVRRPTLLPHTACGNKITNELFQQCLPKGTELSVYYQEEIDQIAESLLPDRIRHWTCSRCEKFTPRCSKSRSQVKQHLITVRLELETARAHVVNNQSFNMSISIKSYSYIIFSYSLKNKATSFAALCPDRIAPFILPEYSSIVSLPAQCIRPTGSRRY